MEAVLGSLVFLVLAIVVAVLWIFTPFIIMGIRNRLDANNKLLQEIRDELKKGNSPAQ
jgi:hypothetical protein